MAKKRKQERLKPWCWYCDREFEDEKILIQHQRMKHFKCSICHRKLNSASGLVIHMAQLHKITMEKVPNAVEGHDTPELEIFGMDGIPQDDLQRHIDGLPIVPYNKTKMILGDSSILPLLAAQKVSVASQLAESKNLIVQGSSASSNASGSASTSGPVSGIISPPLPSSNVIVSPPSTSAVLSSAPLPPMPAAPTQMTSPTMPAYPAGQNPYYAHAAANPYYQQYYAQHYAAYYQQYYAQQYAATAPAPVASIAVQEDVKKTEAAVEAEEAKVEDDNALDAGKDNSFEEDNPIEAGKDNDENNTGKDNSLEEDNPLEAEIETSIVVPPIIVEVNNRMVPGMIFTVPCIDRSIEELRSRLKKYKSK